LVSEEGGDVGDGRDLHKSIGKLWWLLQDELPAAHNTAKRYLDHAMAQESGDESAKMARLCMRTLFPGSDSVCVAGEHHEELQKKLLPQLTPKVLFGVTMNGKMVANLLRVCVDVLNSGQPIVIPTVWERVKHEQTEAALDEVLTSYSAVVGACFGDYDHQGTMLAFVDEMAEFEAEMARAAAEEAEGEQKGGKDEQEGQEDGKLKGGGWRRKLITSGKEGVRGGRFEFWRRRKQRAATIRNENEEQQVGARMRLKSVASLSELIPSSLSPGANTLSVSMGPGVDVEDAEHRLVFPVSAEQVERVHARWLREAETQLMQTIGGCGSSSSDGAAAGKAGSGVGGIVTDPGAQQQLRRRLGQAVAVGHGYKELKARNERAAAQYCAALLHHLHTMVLAVNKSDADEAAPEVHVKRPRDNAGAPATASVGEGNPFGKAEVAPKPGSTNPFAAAETATKAATPSTNPFGESKPVLAQRISSNPFDAAPDAPAAPSPAPAPGVNSKEGAEEEYYEVVVPMIQVREGVAMESEKLCTKSEGDTFMVLERQELQSGDTGMIVRVRLEEGGWTSLTSSSHVGKVLVRRVGKSQASSSGLMGDMPPEAKTTDSADHQRLESMQMYSSGAFKKGKRKSLPASRRKSQDTRGGFIDVDESVNTVGKDSESMGDLATVTRPKGLSISAIPEGGTEGGTAGGTEGGTTKATAPPHMSAKTGRGSMSLGETHAKMEEDGGFKLKSAMQRLAEMEAEESRILLEGAGAARAIHASSAPSTRLVRLAGEVGAYVSEIGQLLAEYELRARGPVGVRQRAKAAFMLNIVAPRISGCGGPAVGMGIGNAANDKHIQRSGAAESAVAARVAELRAMKAVAVKAQQLRGEERVAMREEQVQLAVTLQQQKDGLEKRLREQRSALATAHRALDQGLVAMGEEQAKVADATARMGARLLEYAQREEHRRRMRASTAVNDASMVGSLRRVPPNRSIISFLNSRHKFFRLCVDGQARLDMYASRTAHQRGKAPQETAYLEGARLIPAVSIFAPLFLCRLLYLTGFPLLSVAGWWCHFRDRAAGWAWGDDPQGRERQREAGMGGGDRGSSCWRLMCAGERAVWVFVGTGAWGWSLGAWFLPERGGLGC
jgi:hypothetical protein